MITNYITIYISFKNLRIKFSRFSKSLKMFENWIPQNLPAIWHFYEFLISVVWLDVGTTLFSVSSMRQGYHIYVAVRIDGMSQSMKCCPVREKLGTTPIHLHLL